MEIVSCTLDSVLWMPLSLSEKAFASCSAFALFLTLTSSELRLIVMASHEDHEEEGRPTASLPQRSTGSIKLPLIAPFSAPEEIVQALATRDVPLLTAGELERSFREDSS